MYRPIKKLGEVRKYYLSDGHLLLVKHLLEKNVEFVWLNAKSFAEVWQKEIDFKSFYVLYETSEKLLGYYPGQRVFNLNKTNGDIHVKELDYSPFHQIDGWLYGSVRNDKGGESVSKLKINTLEIVEFFSEGLNFFGGDNNSLLAIEPSNPEVIYCWSIESKKIAWKNKIGTELGTKLYSLSGQFIFGNSAGYLSLDKATGKTLWHIEGVPYIRPYGEMLYGLGAQNYTEIDPVKGEITKQIDLTEECKKADILTGSSFTVGEDYVYFNGSVFDSKIGILEKDTGKIVWTYELPTEYKTQVPVSNVPQVHENRLYVLDAENTLHIFEQE